MKQSERLLFLISSLLKEREEYQDVKIPHNENDQKILLRALLNTRPALEAEEAFLNVQDKYLQEEIKAKRVTDILDLKSVQENLYLWQGDISTLKCDAIVNAANSSMTGCYIPNHNCIDNVIHTYAGVQLRLECNEMMLKQGFEEPIGCAKITKAYNLPCKFIIHTVGPIVYDRVTDDDIIALSSCYYSCLELADKYNLESVAFCCISTGVFNFPNERAAEVAIQAVKTFLKRKTSVKKIIFNVFKDKDREIYERLLKSN